jgi:hypothetical protein
VLCIAVDYSNGTVWWRTNGGNWNNDPSANPSTNIGGQTIGVTGALFWAYGFGSGTNYSAIAKFTAPFTYTPPPGFTGQ